MFILAVVCIAIATSALGQSKPEFRDVVYLKNGSIIKGQIVEQTLDSIIKIQTADGSLFVYSQTEVEKIESEVSPAVPYYKYKNPVASWALSFFLVPGIGQFYNGDVRGGSAFASFYAVSLTLFCVGLVQTNRDDSYKYSGATTYMVGGLLSMGVCWLVSWISAPIQSYRLNREHGLLSWQIGKKSNLALSPDVKLYNNILPAQNTTSTFGMKVSINF
jgi:hypothetical protein